MMNLSSEADDETARTCWDCALQRAENLAFFGAKRVLELCVGPSLKTLEKAYARHGISVVGNDIEVRWKNFHPKGEWIVGDALKIDYAGFDSVVFAPPLSRGCTGTRSDSLMIDDVVPSYDAFALASKEFRGIRTFVLPGRAGATRQDRRQMHSLLSRFENYDLVPLTAGLRKIVKYHDLYVCPSE